jgi:hypothetical protein
MLCTKALYSTLELSYVLGYNNNRPQGVVINPPPQPQQEVVVDLVSSSDE